MFFGIAFAKVLQFLAILVVMRQLRPEHWAMFVAFHALRMLCPRLVWDGLATAMVRYSCEHRSVTGAAPTGLYARCVLWAMGAYALLAAVGVLWAPAAALLLFGRADYSQVVVAGMLAGGAHLLVLQQNRIHQAREQFGHYVGLIWAQSLALLGYVAVLSALGRLTFINVAYGSLALDLAVGGLPLSRTLLAAWQRPAAASSPLRVVLRASGWLMAYHITLVGFSHLDVPLLSHLAGEWEVAQYGVAMRFYAAALLALGAIQAVLLPHFSRRQMQAAGQQRDFVTRWFRHMAWVAVPLVLLGLLGRRPYTWLTGAQYGQSFDIWVILSAGVFISLMCGPMVSILISRGRFAVVFAMGLGALGMCVAGNLLLAPRFGGQGAAAANVAAHALMNVAATAIVMARPRQPDEAPAPMVAAEI